MLHVNINIRFKFGILKRKVHGVFFGQFYSVAFASISASSIATAVTRFDELFDISASRGPARSPVFDRLISLQAF